MKIFTMAIFFLCASTLCFAGNLNIAPIKVYLTPAVSIATLKVTNESDDATIVQSTAMAWQQTAERDNYHSTRDLLIVPPLATIPAHGTQIIRIARLSHTAVTQEQAYRVYVQQVLGASTKPQAGLQLALRIGIPIFVTPAKIQQNVQWQLKSVNPQQLSLQLHNLGNQHMQVTNIALVDARSNKTILNRASYTYLLAGSHREWLIDTPNVKIQFPLKIVLSTDLLPLSYVFQQLTPTSVVQKHA